MLKITESTYFGENRKLCENTKFVFLQNYSCLPHQCETVNN